MGPSSVGCRHATDRFRRIVGSLALTLLVVAAMVTVDAGLRPMAANAAWVQPIQAPVIDPFRPPASPYGRGNRGLEYGNSKGLAVSAVDAGRVMFAGLVAGSRHVVVDHGNGLRSTYAYLDTSVVVRGQMVVKGQIIGRADSGFHLTARLGDSYVDPQLLFAGAEVVLKLTESPLPTANPGSTSWPESNIGQLGLTGSRSLLGPRLPLVVEAATELEPARLFRDASDAVEDWYRLDCTPTGQGRELGGGPPWLGGAPDGGAKPPLDLPGQGRVLIQVGGLGSQAGEAAIGSLDAVGLGYSEDDIAGFSYAGGCTPTPFGLDLPGEESLSAQLSNSSVGSTAYGPDDTRQSVDVSATRLADMIEATARARPGQPIDVAAHSLGGVVARRALTILEDRRQSGVLVPGAMPSVVLTIASPHGGADLASGAAILADRQPGSGVPDQIPDWLDSPALEEISSIGAGALGPPGSPPPGVRVIAAAGDRDLVVPAGAARWPDAVNVLISSQRGAFASHSALPAHPDVAVELGLGIQGLAPRCVPLSEVLVGTAAGTLVQTAERGLNVAIGVARWLL